MANLIIIPSMAQNSRPPEPCHAKTLAKAYFHARHILAHRNSGAIEPDGLQVLEAP